MSGREIVPAIMPWSYVIETLSGQVRNLRTRQHLNVMPGIRQPTKPPQPELPVQEPTMNLLCTGPQIHPPNRL